MKTIMARTPQESSFSFSFSRRYFNWRKKPEEENNDEEILTYESSSHSFSGLTQAETLQQGDGNGGLISYVPPMKKKKLPKFRSALTLFTKPGPHLSPALGAKVIGTLFGYRRGHVSIAFQEASRTNPAFLIQISTPTSVLVREMASGLVRVALECEKKPDRKSLKLLEEPLWRAYCNGKKCGYAARRECGAQEMKVLAAVGPVTMGAGVLPGSGEDGVGAEGELMYMRARFERVVGSKDSEAFYMINPDGNGGPELSVYLLRV